MELHIENGGHPLNLTCEQDFLSLGGDSNTLILQSKKKNKKKGLKEECKKRKTEATPKLSKSQKRKQMKLEEEKEKALLLAKSLETLRKYEIPEGAFSLLKSSRSIGQAENVKRKRKRVVESSVQVLHSEQPYEEMDADNVSTESEPDLDESHSCQDLYRNDQVPPMMVARGFPENDTLSFGLSQHPVDCNESGANDGNVADDCSKSTNLADRTIESTKVEIRNTTPTVVHVSRPPDVEKTRKDLPIVMMEQEIMEAINYHLTVIICGETGCGKTTQVPQFLYEAGFGSRQYVARGGTIGVTQPRRVAVLATARRVAHELGLSLGKEVGFQVRYDKKIGHNSSIKFMTDGILLRELQNDFLLRHYSVIVLDEAHERSLNTDILIGMLSRVIQGREKIYAQQQKLMLSGQTISPENQIFPLKLVLMSATLRVEDFISGKRLFCNPPPVLEVPTRQFPVTTHFSKRTEIVDYIGQAYKKVLAIHKRLPQGGILVFVTGQREVEYLCRKLRRASKELIARACEGNIETDQAVTEIESLEGISIKEINEAYDARGHSELQQTDMFCSKDDDDDVQESNIDEAEFNFSNDSESDSDLEIMDDNGDSLQEKKWEINDGNLMNVLGDDGNLASLKSAFEALAGQAAVNSTSNGIQPGPVTQEARSDQTKPRAAKTSAGGNDSSVNALRVLPLYAMLPAAAQLRVFDNVREGERLVVVATNVAETSLTIPGIKYVVDTGREKVKKYNSSNGMETYEVQWISKASASQRAGRAGRTGPGHCYRLYSSAVYNNIFPDFSLAEILKVPVDGVVLLMKSMHIDKVANFPFPTPPEATALVEAECCLKVLEALDSDGRLTALGKAMSRYPMSPRHSRMLLTVIQMMQKKKSDSRPNLVLAYAVAAAAALSLSNPFALQFENSNTSKGDLHQDGNRDALENSKVLDKEEKLKRKKLKEAARMYREKFCNPSSDALSLAYVLQCFELAKSPTEFCNENCLHLKTMEEMSKLRKQLIQLVFSHSGDCDLEQDFSWTYGTLEDVERSWSVSYNKHPLSLYEEELLGQSICAGWADRVAKRIRRSSKSIEDEGKVRAVRYQAGMVKENVFLHRWSSVSNSAPEFLVYSELLQTKRPYMHGVTRVKPEWLIEYARSLCTFSAPSLDTKPYYEPRTDQVLHYVVPSFGPHLWELAPHSLPISDFNERVAVFAYALLEGQVLPCLRTVRSFMSAPPSSILRPEASGQRRVGNLLTKLKFKFIDSCAKLSGIWMESPRELYPEILDWFQGGFRNKFEVLWSQMLSEAVSEPQERFPRKSKRASKGEKTIKKRQNIKPSD